MDRYLLKNIIIIILVLVNGFLLGSLVMRQTSQHAARRNTEAYVTSLFEADGITLEEGAISRKTPPSSRLLAQDAAQQKKAAVFFLGENVLQDDQSGTSTYTGEQGVARFRSGGSFEIEGKLAVSDAEEVCLRFCKDFSLEEPLFLLDETGSGTATAVCLHEDLPVFNGTVTFTLTQGTLTRISGTLLPDLSAVLSEDREPLSAIAALTAFQQTRRESGAVVSAVLDMELCYELDTSTAGLTLTPAWCVVTDTSKYYVNCSSGAVTSG